MVFKFIKNLFKTSPTDKAFQHCLEADENLLVKVMTFHQSYKAIGIELFPDTSSFEKLEEILKDCDPDSKELTLDGVAAFLGCILREQLGGKWSKTEDGKYKVSGIGNRGLTIDLDEDLRLTLESKEYQRLESLYEKIVKEADTSKRPDSF
jgi:hypothetical protein